MRKRASCSDPVDLWSLWSLLFGRFLATLLGVVLVSRQKPCWLRRCRTAGALRGPSDVAPWPFRQGDPKVGSFGRWIEIHSYPFCSCVDWDTAVSSTRTHVICPWGQLLRQPAPRGRAVQTRRSFVSVSRGELPPPRVGWEGHGAQTSQEQVSAVKEPPVLYHRAAAGRRGGRGALDLHGQAQDLRHLEEQARASRFPTPRWTAKNCDRK